MDSNSTHLTIAQTTHFMNNRGVIFGLIILLIVLSGVGVFFWSRDREFYKNNKKLAIIPGLIAGIAFLICAGGVFNIYQDNYNHAPSINQQVKNSMKEHYGVTVLGNDGIYQNNQYQAKTPKNKEATCSNIYDKYSSKEIVYKIVCNPGGELKKIKK